MNPDCLFSVLKFSKRLANLRMQLKLAIKKETHGRYMILFVTPVI